MRKNLHTVIATAAAILLFLILFFVGWNRILIVVLSIGLYFALDILLTPRRKIGSIDVESLKSGDEILSILDEARNDLGRIRKASDGIRDQKVSSDAEKLLDTGNRILSYLQEHPDKIRLSRRFFTYYLDTTGDILEHYQELQQTELDTPEVKNIMERTASALPILSKAFDQQFERLMEGDLMDVEADIKVLESTLKMEGLTPASVSEGEQNNPADRAQGKTEAAPVDQSSEGSVIH